MTLGQATDEQRVTLSGAVDAGCAPWLRTLLLDLIDDGVTRLTVDLHAVTLLDARAVGVLVHARQRAVDAGGALRAVRARGRVLAALEITGTAKDLGAYDTVPATATRQPPDATITALLTEARRWPADHPRGRAVRGRAIELALPYARHLARRYQGRRETPEDLDQVAAVGLIKAVDGWNPQLGPSFTGYATPTILGELKRHFRDHGWQVRVPRHLQELRLAINRAREDLDQKLGRSVTAADVAEHLGVDIEEIIEALGAAAAYRPVSLATPVGTDGEDTLADLCGTVDDGLAGVENRAAVAAALARLPERSRQIVALRFYREMSQSQIGAVLGISQMHVSRLLARSLRDLRELLAADG